MFRPTTLATLSVLALSGCIATPASAQHLYGNLHGSFAHDHSYSHYDHGHRYHYGHGDYHGYGHAAYPNTAMSRHRAIPVYAEAACPYGNDPICSEPNGCPLQRGRTYPNLLTDEYQPGFDLASPGQDHSHTGDSHSGHSHDGHSHDRQNPSRDVAPSDLGYLATPSLPRDSARDYQPQQDFRREQPQPDDSIRMDGPPPASFGPNSSAPAGGSRPNRFDTPPPSTL
ncbi:MAG: hypothetical protein KDA89_01455 [Planctomycetaceae bacterium]|nr:hypothetical protein [Planctomycetaceae bacterium]MCA9047362.1 hypothetical protein [Planctomycetaceae bacterium]